MKTPAFEQDALEQLELCLSGATTLVAKSSQLSTGVAYALFPAGKRIRPLLALALHSDLGGDLEKLVPAAAALELVHCASLVHDDLPALDNDEMRRGKPTCHRALGEATAILTGDVLIPIAFQLLLSALVPDRTKVQLGAALAEAYAAVCAGQQLDLTGAADLATLRAIHGCKTGALFAAAARFGVLGAERDDLAGVAAELGHHIGLAFQILDDHLDVHGNPAERGRPNGSDARNAKNTFVTLDPAGAGVSFRDARARTKEILDSLTSAGCPRTTAILDRLFAGATL